MSAIDNAKVHFAGFGIQQLEVPEWGEEGKPLVIFWKPMTLAEKQRLATVGEQEGYISRLADCLILKALDGQGEKLFTLEHKHSLRHAVDPDVLARIVTRMMAAPAAGELGKS